MNILALDTSTEYCSAALWLDGTVSALETQAGQRHSELILPMCRELLADAGVNLNAIDGIAFGAGPGSFTGLRIACGVAQGLALGAGLPVVGVCTLQALAESSGASRAIAAMDARMGEIYLAAYEHRGDWQEVCEPGLYAPGNLPRIPGTSWTGCGNAFEIHGDALQRRYGAILDTVRPELIPHARDIARLAVPIIQQGLGVDPAEASPLYIRNKVALKETER